MTTESQVACPERESLAALIAGRLSEQIRAPLEDHLLKCDSCAKAAETLWTRDDLTRTFVHSRNIEDSPALSKVIDRAAVDTAPLGEPRDPEIEPVAKVGKDEIAIDFLAPARRSDEIGRLGHYRLLDVLGAGGMGIVFRAEDPKLQRQVE